MLHTGLAHLQAQLMAALAQVEAARAAAALGLPMVGAGGEPQKGRRASLDMVGKGAAGGDSGGYGSTKVTSGPGGVAGYSANVRASVRMG